MTQQQAVLLLEADLPRADRGSGASTTRLVNRSCSSQSMINGITTIPPKSAIPPHYHNALGNGKAIAMLLAKQGAIIEGTDIDEAAGGHVRLRPFAMLVGRCWRRTAVG